MTPRSLKTSLCYKYITKNFKRPDTKRNFKSRPKQHRQLSRNPKDNLFVTRSLVDTDSFDLAKQVQVSLPLSLSLPLKICVLDSRGHKSQALASVLQPRQGLAAVLSRPRFNRAVYPRACSRSSQHLSTTIDGYVNR